jgi:hypothetical protein
MDDDAASTAPSPLKLGPQIATRTEAMIPTADGGTGYEIEGQLWYMTEERTFLGRKTTVLESEHSVVVLYQRDANGILVPLEEWTSYTYDTKHARDKMISYAPGQRPTTLPSPERVLIGNGRVSVTKEQFERFQRLLSYFSQEAHSWSHPAAPEPFKNPTTMEFNCHGILEWLAEQAGIRDGRGFIDPSDEWLINTLGWYDADSFANRFGIPRFNWPYWWRFGVEIEAMLPLEWRIMMAIVNSRVVASWDPNDKVGPPGPGLARYISAEGLLDYRVFFENAATATAAARTVVLTDALDRHRLDYDSFELGEIVIGDKRVAVPVGLRSYQTDVDLRPERNLLVRVAAGLDDLAGTASWSFASIDPSTGLPPEDPLIGFLPPNTAPPVGEGSVSFHMRAKPGLPTGDEIRNQAAIRFDNNPVMLAPETPWFNTVDGAKPASRVVTLQRAEGDSTYLVEWAGSDEGSQVRDYSVFVSEDDGPFTPWLVNAPAVGGIFRGRSGAAYAFYSVARDSAGNLEEHPDVPDMSTGDLPTPALCSLVSIGSEPGVVRIKWYVAAEGAAPVTVYRNATGDDWAAIAQHPPDGSGFIEIEDRDVVSGGRYGYRLGILTDGQEVFSGDTWITVPSGYRLNLEGARPNPSIRGLSVMFSLPSRGDAVLELLDVAGRRLLTLPVGECGPGNHVVALEPAGGVAPGMYLVRLTSGGQSITRKAVVLSR